MKRVTLYTKPGCHLCESVEQVIESVRQRVPLQFEKRDITADAGEFAKYQFDIPVVTIDGKEVAKYRLTARELEDLLASAV